MQNKRLTYEKLFTHLWSTYRYNPADRTFYNRKTNRKTTSDKGIKVFGKRLPVGIVFKIYFRLLEPDTPEVNAVLDQLKEINVSDRIKNYKPDNRPIPDNTNPSPGVSWFKPSAAYQVRIYLKGRLRTLGYRKSLDEALQLRREAELIKMSDPNVKVKTAAPKQSGVSGVIYDKRHDSWRVRFRKNGVIVDAGTFKSLDEAIAARKQAMEAHV